MSRLFVPFLILALLLTFYLSRGDGIPLTNLPPPHLCVCPKPESKFSSLYDIIYVMAFMCSVF